MKRRYIASIVLFSITSIITFGQVTEVEKKSRTLSADTTLGWKKGGVFAVNLAQTSLTNWAAGGENSIAVNGIVALFANLKQGKSRWIIHSILVMVF